MSAVVLAPCFESVPSRLAALTQLSAVASEFREQLSCAVGHSQGLLRARQVLNDALHVAIRVADYGSVPDLRAASHVLADGSWMIWARSSVLISRTDVAIAQAEAVKWDAVGRRGSQAELWQRLGSLLAAEIEDGAAIFAGDVESVGRAYLRALAYFSAGLDLLEDVPLWQTVGLIDACVPFLDMSRRAVPGPHYVVDPLGGVAPMRCLDGSVSKVFHFSTRVACESLMARGRPLARDGSEGAADNGLCPADVALQHLLRVWAPDAPTRRHRRHVLGDKARLVQGVDACLQLVMGDSPSDHILSSVSDVSRSSMAVLLPDPGPRGVLISQLVGVQFEDANQVQLGFVRRVRVESRGLFCGLQLVSRAATHATVEDGRSSVSVLVCDPVCRGDVVRLIAGQSGVLRDASLFLKVGAAVFKLRALDTAWTGQGYELRAYQLV